MAHGDPKRVVGAYLTKVEEGEEKLLAATTARAVEAALEAGRHAARQRRTGTRRPRSSRLTRRRTCSRRRKDAGARARSRSPTSSFLDRDGQPSFVFHSGDPMSVRVKVRAAQPVDDFVFGIGLFNADGVCCYGTNTYLEEMTPERLDRRSRGDVRHREPRPRRRHLQARRRRPQERRLSVRLPPPALHVPREVADPRRRHLPAAPPLDVLAGRALQDTTRLMNARHVPPCRSDVTEQLATSSTRVERQARRSSSPTASSTCCTSATCAICSTRARLGDALIVGVNSDRSVRADQGTERPITPEARARRGAGSARRASTPSSIFDEDTPRDLIAALQPDVLVKGADWAEDAIVGRDIVEARGGRVVRVAIEPGHSTSAIIDRIRRPSH